MRMKNRHYQQVKLNKEALSVGEEEGSSVQREENRTSRRALIWTVKIEEFILKQVSPMIRLDLVSYENRDKMLENENMP